MFVIMKSCRWCWPAYDRYRCAGAPRRHRACDIAVREEGTHDPFAEPADIAVEQSTDEPVEVERNIDHRLGEQALLAPEPVIDHRCVDICTSSDRAHRGAFVAVIDEHLTGRVEQGGACVDPARPGPASLLGPAVAHVETFSGTLLAGFNE